MNNERTSIKISKETRRRIRSIQIQLLNAGTELNQDEVIIKALDALEAQPTGGALAVPADVAQRKRRLVKKGYGRLHLDAKPWPLGDQDKFKKKGAKK